AIIFLRSYALPDSRYLGAALKWISSWDEVPLLGYADSGRLNAYVLWSLRYEWLFYILLLPMCAAAMDSVRTLRWPTWLVPAGFLIAAISGRMVVRKVGLSVPVLGYLPLFAIGMLAYELSKSPAIKSALMKPWIGVLVFAGLIVGMLISSSPYGIALPFFSFFFVCVACGNSFGGLLGGRGALILGECSFSIYLLHGIILDILFVEASGFHARIATQFLPIVLPLATLAVTAVAAISFLVIERPSISLGKRLARWLSRSNGKLTPQELEVAP
ncbi:MAG: acyltransferase family protein, partial [Alphaproteobacteria bacterium]|nr:acyltransferase family protein [Alphaproteobacteria bacterium]